VTHRSFRPVAVACAAALAVSAAAQERQPERQPDRQPAGGKAVTDAEFVKMAASGGLFEVKSSKMAVEKAAKAECKAFAEMMIKDHTKANEELKAAAGKAGLAVPAELAPHHQKMLDDLKGARDFDAAYMNAQVKAHEEAVALFTAASTGVKDPALRDFAAKTLPTIKTHLDHVKKHAKGDR
jgi:putative membrane protein